MDYIKRVNNMLMSNELMTKKGNVLSTRGEGRSGKEGRQGGVVRAGATQSEHWQEAGEQGGDRVGQSQHISARLSKGQLASRAVQ